MNDDPISFLNLQEEPVQPIGKRGKWWLVSLLSLVGCPAAGIILALALANGHSDWGVPLICAGGGLLLGAFLCVVFATVSYAREEQNRIWALLVAVPSLIFLAWLLAMAVESQYQQWKYRQAAAERAGYLQQIKADPALVLREHWGQLTDQQHMQVLRESLEMRSVQYTAGQLERLYEEAPALRILILAQPACAPEFLTAHVPEACAAARQYSWPMLDAIMQNPSTPLPVVESLSRSAQLPAGALRQAKATFDRRKPPPPPRPASPPAPPPLLVLGPARYSFDQDSTPSSVRFEQFQHHEAALAGKYAGLKIQSLPMKSLPDGRTVAAPRTIVLSVPGMPHLMEKEDYRNVYFLPELFSFEGDDATRRAMLAAAFATEHNKELLKQRGHE